MPLPETARPWSPRHRMPTAQTRWGARSLRPPTRAQWHWPLSSDASGSGITTRGRPALFVLGRPAARLVNLLAPMDEADSPTPPAGQRRSAALVATATRWLAI